MTERTAVSVDKPLADEHCCWELAECIVTLLDLALANKQHFHEATKRTEALAKLVLANG
jgi:hypothetical protein